MNTNMYFQLSDKQINEMGSFLTNSYSFVNDTMNMNNIDGLEDVKSDLCLPNTAPAFLRLECGNRRADEYKADQLIQELIVLAQKVKSRTMTQEEEEGCSGKKSPATWNHPTISAIPSIILGEFVRVRGNKIYTVLDQTGTTCAQDALVPWILPNGKYAVRTNGSVSYWNYILALTLSKFTASPPCDRQIGNWAYMVLMSLTTTTKFFPVRDMTDPKWTQFREEIPSTNVTFFANAAFQYSKTTGKFSVIPKLAQISTQGVGKAEILLKGPPGAIVRPPQDAYNLVLSFFGDLYPRKELLDYMLFSYGLALVPRSQKSIFCHVGPSGTGKSTLVKFLSHVFGTYTQDLGPNAFISIGTQANSNLFKCKGKRLIFMNEAGKKPFNGELAKRICSDEITTRDLYEGSQSFELDGIIHIFANTPPQFTHLDDALRYRLKCVPYTTVFQGSKKYDSNIEERLKEHGCTAFLDLIKNAVEKAGTCDLNGENITQPEIMRIAQAEWYGTPQVMTQQEPQNPMSQQEYMAIQARDLVASCRMPSTARKVIKTEDADFE